VKFTGICPIRSVTLPSPKIIRLEIECLHIASSARPGQFIQVRIPDKETNIWPRPFSIHHVERDRLTLYIKIFGKMTSHLGRLTDRDSLSISGPLGNGFSEPSEPTPLFLVAGGVGLPPLHFLVRSLLKKGYPSNLIHLYSGAKSAADLFARDELNALNIDYHIVTEDGSLGIKGLVIEPFSADLAKTNRAQIYACGPMAMMAEVAKIAGNNPCQLSLEQLMPCGWGVCNGCAVKLKSDNSTVEDERGFRLARVCKEGPVFEAGDIQWE
jgi:dihydroorotate dehydrogenase electron transfer subunit